VDPKALEYANQGSYVYAANNPIMMQDFNGEGPKGKGGTTNKTTKKVESKGTTGGGGPQVGRKYKREKKEQQSSTQSNKDKIVQEIEVNIVLSEPNPLPNENITSGVKPEQFLKPAQSDNTGVALDKTNPLDLPNPEEVKKQEEKKQLQVKLQKMTDENKTEVSQSLKPYSYKYEQGQKLGEEQQKKLAFQKYIQSHTPFEQSMIQTNHIGAKLLVDIYSPAAKIN